jgi:hypothetical protein
MLKGPQGQKRPGDVIGAAIMVAKIATGEITEAEATEDDGKGDSALDPNPEHDLRDHA